MDGPSHRLKCEWEIVGDLAVFPQNRITENLGTVCPAPIVRRGGARPGGWRRGRPRGSADRGEAIAPLATLRPPLTPAPPRRTIAAALQTLFGSQTATQNN